MIPTSALIVAVVLFFATTLIVRNRFIIKIKGSISQTGFAEDDEEVTIILANGTSVKGKWIDLRKRIVGDKKFFIMTQRDWLIGGFFCFISIAVPLAIGYFGLFQPRS